MNTHNITLDFGKWNGELLTRVPVHYLRWMTQALDRPGPGGSWKDLAAAELERRGERRNDIEISSHAIDRASQRALGEWKETRKDNEGLYTWLERRAAEAFALRATHGTEEGDRVLVLVHPIVWVFDTAGVVPTVLTLKHKKGRKHGTQATGADPAAGIAP